MSSTIDLGIDLGTTNSAIAHIREGEPDTYENPHGGTGRPTLPSAVGYRKNRIMVGQKALDYAYRDPGNVVTKFKRKMGTSESFPIESLGTSKTPIELSARVLKELKTFIRGNETAPRAAVITIPASFDTVQSNATKEAGNQAGFEQVVLLQEPIAASLAYANKPRSQSLGDGQWLVYDFGGGTFDVALVKMEAGEMRVLDHEGDNYLGGADFDQLIVEEVIIPRLEELGSFTDLEKEMKNAGGRYEKDYARFLQSAEQAKIELSSRTSAYIDVERIKDEDREEIFEEITLTRSDFEDLIKEKIDRTAEMIQKMLTRNSVASSDLKFTLMIGGSTYIPYVRKRIGEMLEVDVNCDIDPTTAVALGAAHYAGTKRVDVGERTGSVPADPDALPLKIVYHPTSQDESEFLAARFDGPSKDLPDGFRYRVVRQDGGYDSGLKPLKSEFSETLPLVENTYNRFEIKVYDDTGNEVPTNAEPINIAHGKTSVAGQPLPHDISLERDDLENETTVLYGVFDKNDVLPLRREMSFPINRTIKEGSNEAIRIRVFEGPQEASPESNKPIGRIEITGDMLNRDAVKGSDLELTLKMSESRDLTVSAFVTMTGQEFQEVFDPQPRSLAISEIKGANARTRSRLNEEIKAATEQEDYERSEELRRLKQEADLIDKRVSKLSANDTTDDRYQLQDEARRISQQVDEATADKYMREAQAEYHEAKSQVSEIVYSDGNDEERQIFEGITARESAFLSSSSPKKVREKTAELHRLVQSVLMRTPGFLRGMFENLKRDQSRMNNQSKARNLVESGEQALQRQNWDRLRQINYDLIGLLPQGAQAKHQGRIGY